jgi:cytidine deaminase
MKLEAPLSRLLKAARDARKNAYAPWSKFKVGAAVLAGGRIFAAANVENSSYPLSMCAERNAAAMAVAAGYPRIEAVGVSGSGPRATAPCGGCRQVLWELCGERATMPVVYAGVRGPAVTTTIGALLPRPFGPQDLGRRVAPGRRRRRAAV